MSPTKTRGGRRKKRRWGCTLVVKIPSGKICKDQQLSPPRDIFIRQTMASGGSIIEGGKGGEDHGHLRINGSSNRRWLMMGSKGLRTAKRKLGATPAHSFPPTL